jgi:hypothetical protein
LYSGGPRRKGDEESGPSGAAAGRRHHRTHRDANADLNAGKKRKISKSADEIRSMVKEVNFFSNFLYIIFIVSTLVKHFYTFSDAVTSIF